MRNPGSSRQRLLIALLALWLAGCASREPDEVRAERRTIVSTAMDQLGRPYHYGGSDPSGFDCSGLVQYSYRSAGLSIPRSTGELRHAGRKINLRDARPGDVLLYRFTDRLHPSMHVAIFLGDGMMVHAPASGGQVETVALNQSPWPERFVSAIRLLR